MLGTNNLEEDTPRQRQRGTTTQPLAIVEELLEISSLLVSKNRQLKVAIGNLIPRDDQWKEKGKTVSNIISHRGAEEGWLLCPVHKTFLKKKHRKLQLIDTDGLHLTQWGTDLVKNYLTNFVEANFK